MSVERPSLIVMFLQYKTPVNGIVYYAPDYALCFAFLSDTTNSGYLQLFVQETTLGYRVYRTNLTLLECGERALMSADS